jgi:D-alanyl-D-alanine carboxypeptidase
MANNLKLEDLNQSIKKMVDGKSIFSVAMKVENGDGSISWSGAAGGMQVEVQVFYCLRDQNVYHRDCDEAGGGR